MNSQINDTLLRKQQEIKKLFTPSSSQEERYRTLIDLGKSLELMPLEERIPVNLVPGCQSVMYLHCSRCEGRLQFRAHSEALISAGLAALLISVYNGESAETILKCPPLFIDELGISASLTPGRSNGLASIYLRMKQEALKILVAAS